MRVFRLSFALYFCRFFGASVELYWLRQTENRAERWSGGRFPVALRRLSHVSGKGTLSPRQLLLLLALVLVGCQTEKRHCPLICQIVILERKKNQVEGILPVMETRERFVSYRKQPVEICLLGLEGPRHRRCLL